MILFLKHWKEFNKSGEFLELKGSKNRIHNLLGRIDLKLIRLSLRLTTKSKN